MHDGVTGGALVDEQRVGAGDRVLVVGASGGLGIVLVQLARARGARVVALARDERKLARVRALGADAVIDSDAPDWTARARAALGGDGADVVFDNVGGDLGEAAFGLIAPAAGSPPTAPRAAGSRRSPRKRRPPATSPCAASGTCSSRRPSAAVSPSRRLAAAPRAGSAR